jgi:hypothetical protein
MKAGFYEYKPIFGERENNVNKDKKESQRDER